MEEQWKKKWLIRVEHVVLDNGFTTEWFNLKECEIYDGDDLDEGEEGHIEDGDMIDDGSMYKGQVVNYTQFVDIIENDGLCVVDTLDEDYHVMDSLEQGREKFNDLIKNTWSQE